MSQNVPPPYVFVPPEQPYARDSRTMICGPYRINTVTDPDSNETYENRPKVPSFHDSAEHPLVAPWAQPGIEHPVMLSDPTHYGYRVNHRVFAPNIPVKMGSKIQIVEPVTNMNYGDTKQISMPEVTPMPISENEPSINSEQQRGTSQEAEVQITYGRHANRETWDTKIDFLLAVIGFAVDLGNIWRFPYVCYRNGGGIGFGICIIASYTAWYYNTVMALSLIHIFDAMRPTLPWDSCNNWWNTNSCITVYKQFVNMSALETDDGNDTNYPHPSSNLSANQTMHYSSTEEYFYYTAWYYNTVMAWLLFYMFDAMRPTLPWDSCNNWWNTNSCITVYKQFVNMSALETDDGNDTNYPHPSSNLSANQTMHYSSTEEYFYRKVHRPMGRAMCLSQLSLLKDAQLVSQAIQASRRVVITVVYSTNVHCPVNFKLTLPTCPGLVFIAYPEAIATLKGSTFWAIIFMLMLITLGLDSTFGGLEAIITAVLDKIPNLRRRREVFVLIIIIYCFTGALATTTCGGYLILTLLDTHGAPISILFIVFCECVALCWFYGTKRFCADIRMMLGFTPGKFWQICWTFISPLFLLGIFIANLVYYEFKPISVMGTIYEPHTWVIVTAWLIVFSSLIFIPIMMVVQLARAKGTLKEGIFIANLVYYEFKPISVMGTIYEPHTWVIVTAWLIVFSSLIFIPIMMVVQLARAKGTLKERLRYLITPEARPVFNAQKMQITAIEDNDQQEKGIEKPLSTQKLNEVEPI
ncbi:hypothetical protein AHF37_00745 [Paragonimus kellicotti]|nr:hypothetical protein AHF37_00745 [Paragonimus kellicotti]